MIDTFSKVRPLKVIESLNEAISNAAKEYESLISDIENEEASESLIGNKDGEAPESFIDNIKDGNSPLMDTHSNYLVKGDNLNLLLRLIKTGEKLSLIYIDPPFFTKLDKAAVVDRDGEKTKETAYKDSWNSMGEYLEMLALRIMLIRDVLSADGLIFLHVDWHAVHLIRIIMDEIFGGDKFVNEIIWQYKSGGSTKKHFARKHDNILVYSKTKKYKFNPQKEKSYNRGLKPYRFKGVEEFQDEVGWYTVVNMKDVWSLDMVGRTSSERTGYATQKPEKLMERIILSGSDPGDRVGDFFCGSGTLGVAASKLGRTFIMCDYGDLSIDITKDRLEKEGIDFNYLYF